MLYRLMSWHLDRSIRARCMLKQVRKQVHDTQIDSGVQLEMRFK